MASATGPVPITTAAKTRQTLIERGVMMQFGQAAPILDRLKVKDIGTRDYKWARVTKNVANPDYSAIGAGFPTVHTDIEQMSTVMNYFGFQVDVDKREIQDKNNFEDPRQFQVKTATTHQAFFVMDQFINGNPAVQRTVTINAKKVTVNPLAGVKYALDNQTISGLTNLKVDAAGVNISPAGNSPTNSRLFARKLDVAIRQVGNGQGKECVILAPFEITSALGDINRQGGMFKTTADSFGRQVPTWGDFNIPILDAGLISGNPQLFDASTSANRVIGWETSAGVRDDSSNFSSLYILDFSADALGGVEQYGMSVKDLGLLQSDGVTYRTVVDWSLGIRYGSPTCALRLYDITVK